MTSADGDTSSDPAAMTSTTTDNDKESSPQQPPSKSLEVKTEGEKNTPVSSSPQKASTTNKKPIATPVPEIPIIDTRTRNETHSKLRAYEARRRSAYTSKLESSTLYWRSFRDLLHASVHETARAERLVLGSAKANATYANAMKATYDDIFLDDKGNVISITDKKKQKKIYELRMAAQALSNTTTLGTAQQLQQQQQELSSKEGGDEQQQQQSSSNNKNSGMLLTNLIESQKIIGLKFDENSKLVENEIALELTNLRNNLQSKVSDIEKLGDAIINELDMAENEVENAWDAYYAMAIKVLNSSAGGGSFRRSGVANGGGGEGGDKQQSTTSGGEESDNKTITENCNDVWVVEMQYRVAVAYQSMSWEKGSSELSKLFASMKDAECNRRVQLRETLIAFLNRQERLFLSLPSIQTPVLKDLVERQMDRDTIEDNVQQSIRKRAQTLQKEDAKTKAQEKASGGSSSKDTKDKKSGPGLTGVDENDGDFTLESPLMSELLCKAKVVEMKSSGMMSKWRTVLAVITADAFLHLFDLPPGRVQSGSAPEVAFHALVPTVQVSTFDNINKNSSSGGTAAGGGASGGGGSSTGWNDNLTPSESLVLSNCVISGSDGDGTTNSDSFEVTETLFNTGASKVFGKTSTRKLQLRTRTKEETNDWVVTLKAQQQK